jgi:hypothetical protein
VEIHPDAFEDPETENRWVLPSLPNPASVPDNTKSAWIFYFWSGAPNPWQRRISVAITREITPPWRRGIGIMCRGSRTAWAAGIWVRGTAPRILTDTPAETDWQKTAARAKDLEMSS